MEGIIVHTEERVNKNVRWTNVECQKKTWMSNGEITWCWNNMRKNTLFVFVVVFLFFFLLFVINRNLVWSWRKSVLWIFQFVCFFFSRPQPYNVEIYIFLELFLGSSLSNFQQLRQTIRSAFFKSPTSLPTEQWMIKACADSTHWTVALWQSHSFSMKSSANHPNGNLPIIYF